MQKIEKSHNQSPAEYVLIITFSPECSFKLSLKFAFILLSRFKGAIFGALCGN